MILEAKEVLIGAKDQKTISEALALGVKTTLERAAYSELSEAKMSSKKIRDAATQLIAETYNKASASITDQEIEIKQETVQALNALMVEYAQKIFTVEEETKALIAQKMAESASAFWGDVLKIGGTVLGAAAGALIAGPAGAVAGAKLGEAAGGLVADVAIDDDEQAGFHNPIHDHLAYLAGERAAESSERRQFYQQQAEDFSTYFGRGYSGANPIDEQPSEQEKTIIVEIPVGDEVIRAVTRRQLELDDDGSNWTSN